MITLTILLIALAILVISGILAVLGCGLGFLLTFGDVILCAFIVYLIIKHFVKKKRD